MKTYNVNEIAEMLNTNPETVRRWVRNKKLHAETVSRKDGTVITESELEKFLDASPKYARIAAMGLGLSAPVAVPIAVTALLGGAVIEHMDYKDKTELRIHSKEVIKLLSTEISNVGNEIQSTKEEIARKENEVHRLEQRLVELKEAVNKLEADSI